MSYRPITDLWILARPKVKYYGAYPNGFLERALPLIGANERMDVLHLCAGRARDYPNKRLVARAITVDVDPKTQPNFCLDLSDSTEAFHWLHQHGPWPAILVDPPYTEQDHAKYATGGAALPSANALLRLALDLVAPGCRVGVLHYVWPQPPKTARSIACVGVVAGFNNRMRCFSVFEKRVDAAESARRDIELTAPVSAEGD